MKDKKDFYRLHAEICRTIASPKRLEILDALRDNEMTVGGLAAKTGMSQANLSQHLAVLRSGGVVSTRRQGNNVYYALADPRIMQAYDLICEMLRETWARQNRVITEALGAG